MDMIQKERFYTAMITILAVIRVAWEHVRAFTHSIYKRVRANKTACKAFHIAGVCLLVCLSIALYTVVIFRVASKQAVEKYEVHLAEVRAQEEAEALAAEEVDPYTIQLNAEAEALAKVLYGVRDNDTDDLKTYCWCVFNRVENSAFPSTLEDVIAQPNQWMRYDQTNPILEDLYQLAREQLDVWHTDTHRPVSNEYVFMSWSSNDICLRDNFYEGSNCHYWRWRQK